MHQDMTQPIPEGLLDGIERWSLSSLPDWSERVKVPTTSITTLSLVVRQDTYWAEWWWDLVLGRLGVRLSGEYRMGLFEMRNQSAILPDPVRSMVLEALSREEGRHEGLVIQPHRKGLSKSVKTKVNPDDSTNASVTTGLPIFGQDFQEKASRGQRSTRNGLSKARSK